jgi:hypothetical protein
MKYELTATKGSGLPMGKLTMDAVRDDDLEVIIDAARRKLLNDPDTDAVEIKRIP